MRTRSIQAFHDELVRAVSLGADFLVAHPGSGLGTDREQAIAEIAQGMRHAAKGMKLGRPANPRRKYVWNGLGCRARVLKRSRRSWIRPGICRWECVSTRRIRSKPGTTSRPKKGSKTTLAAVDRTVGLDRVYVLHVNDSKTPLGSRVDRHEHIGRGKIGLAAFGRILNHARLGPGFQGLPGRAFILETPIDRPGDDRRNVRALWELVGVSVRQAPKAENGFSMVKAKKKAKASTQRAQRKTKTKARMKSKRSKKFK